MRFQQLKPNYSPFSVDHSDWEWPGEDATEDNMRIQSVSIELSNRSPVCINFSGTESTMFFIHGTTDDIIAFGQNVERLGRELAGSLAEEQRLARLPSADPMLPARDVIDEMADFDVRR